MIVHPCKDTVAIIEIGSTVIGCFYIRIVGLRCVSDRNIGI